MRVLPSLFLALAAASAARADFRPGFVYVSDTSVKPCSPHTYNDRIWEVDPASGAYRVFAEFPAGLCGGLWGLAFSPDGTRLRGAMAFSNRIVELDGDGNMRVVLGPNDGIGFPQGSNSIAFDAFGDFYVSNGDFTIRRFPAEGGPGEVFADRSDGVREPGALAFAPDGDLFYAPRVLQSTIIRISLEGEGRVFAPGGFVQSLDVDSAGNLYVLTGRSILVYDDADPQAPRVLAENVTFGINWSTMALSVDERTAFVAESGRLFAVETATGDSRQLVQLETGIAGSGIAVFVPEPPSAATFALALIALWTVRRGIVPNSAGGESCATTVFPSLWLFSHC